MSLDNPQLTSYSPEVAAFCLVIGGLSLKMMDSLSGNLGNIDKYISSRSWDFLKTTDTTWVSYIWYFRIIIISLILMSPIALFVWSGTLFYHQIKGGNNVIAPVAVIMIGCFVICFSLGVFYLKWKGYKPSYASMIFLVIGAGCLMTYQLCGNFLDVTERSFFGISAVFLSYNGIILMILIFLHSGKNSSTFLDIIEEKVAIKAEVNLLDDDEEFAQQVAAQSANKEYRVSRDEFKQFYTITDDDAGLLRGGILSGFTSFSVFKQLSTSLIIYACSVGILVGYAFIIYYSTPEYKLGFITLIALLTTDTVIYALNYVGLTQSVLQLCFLSIVFRCCLFGFGGYYWFYGYCLLYGILGIIITTNIAAKHFPLVDVLQSDVLRANTDSEIGSKYLKDLMKTPEFILGYATVMFLILTIALQGTKPDGVPLPSLGMDTAYPFWSMALLSFGCVILCYLLSSIIRILLRKKQNMIDDVHVFFFARFFDVFWIHVYTCYALFVIAGIIAYSLSGNNAFIILACYLPMIIILILYVYIYYSANDYRVFKDITAENAKRAYQKKMKNKRIAGDGKFISPVEAGPVEMKEVDQEAVDQPPNEEKVEDAGVEEKKTEMPKGVEGEEKKEDTSILGSPGKDDTTREGKKLLKSPIVPKPKAAQEKISSPSVTEKPVGGKRTSALKLAFNVDRKATTKAKDASMIEGRREDKESDKGLLEMALEEAEATDELEDWSKDSNAFCAFFTCRLHHQDYRIIFAMIAIIVLIFLIALTLQVSNNYDGAWYGVTLGFILFDSLMVIAPFYRHIRTDIPFDLPQIIMFSIGVAAHVIYGIIYFAAVQKADMDVHNNAVWLYFYIIFVPGIITLSCGLIKYYFVDWRVNPFTIIMTSITVGLIVIFTILLWYRYGWVAGIIVLIIDALIVYGAVLTYFYAANNYFMPFGFTLANIILICLAACAVMIASWVVDSFAPFVGFSVTYALINIGALIYFIIKFLSSLSEYATSPMFISPYVFPVYAYNPRRQTSITDEFSAIGIYSSFASGILWSILLAIYLQPMHYGISVSCILMVIIIFFSLFLVTFTSMKLQECKEFITESVLTTSWLQAKKKFVEKENAINMKELVSYKELGQALEKVQNKTDEQDENEIRLSSTQKMNITISKLTPKQQFDLMFDIEENMKERYISEINLVVDFQLQSMLAAISALVNFQTKTINFLKSREAKLKEFGIDIKYKGITDANVRHSLIMTQYKKLNTNQQAKYNELYTEFEGELDEIRRKNEEREKSAKEADEKRRQKMIEMEKEKENKKKNVVDQSNLPITEMFDCKLKYDKIKAAHNEQNQYVDNQFPPNEKSLGEGIKQNTSGWKRATKDMVIYDKTINAMDVKQGYLGDCYFLSAMSVLGDKYVKECIISTENEKECGAFLVRLFKGGEDREEIIIDNNFPVKDENWAFVRSETNKELWPMILEKAYAKMNGAYENIEAGKVQYALADLTGGAPEQIKLDSVCDNLDAFWEKIYSYYKAGYLMGAGSPENEKGDRCTSADGIVQGHAYAVLELNDFEGEKVIKIRNPHGSKGVEWTGDWSDGSPKWTEAAITKLKYVNEEDGVFWMSLSDFVCQYANLYICRIFDEKWKSEIIDGAWEGKAAAGLPNKRNRDAKMENNPHYLISVTRPCTLFIKLRQKEKLNMFKGKLPIYFLVANNGSTRISTKNSTMVCDSGAPTDLIAVTKEIVMDSSFSYPARLSILAATTIAGQEGQGTFSFTVWSTDKQLTVTPLTSQ